MRIDEETEKRGMVRGRKLQLQRLKEQIKRCNGMGIVIHFAPYNGGARDALQLVIESVSIDMYMKRQPENEEARKKRRDISVGYVFLVSFILLLGNWPINRFFVLLFAISFGRSTQRVDTVHNVVVRQILQ